MRIFVVGLMDFAILDARRCLDVYVSSVLPDVYSSFVQMNKHSVHTHTLSLSLSLFVRVCVWSHCTQISSGCAPIRFSQNPVRCPPKVSCSAGVYVFTILTQYYIYTPVQCPELHRLIATGTIKLRSVSKHKI